ncbi:MAG TPA: hypothetical protein VHW60_07755 [Caulobacteraceae bacterium]|nr:hypothetical protein [Caulobacteraceae bacterium]
MRTTISVPAQFRGPPNSVNGGYACGLMGKHIDGPSTAVLRAPPPLDTPMLLIRDGDVVRLEGETGVLIGEARPGDASIIPPAPPAPSLAAAARAATSFVGLTRMFHPICFTCGDKVDEGVGLRVFVGQVEGAADGVVAGPWTPHPVFAEADGLIATEVVWAALDCPGSVSWVVQGGGGGLLGTMTCEVLRRPRAGEPTIVAAWPVERSGRKSISGTALFTETGELLAHSHQVWIGRAMVSEGGVGPAKAAAV